MSKTIEMIKAFEARGMQEEKDKQFFDNCEKQEQILTRDNERAHLTSSYFILNKTWDKVLCTYHNIFNSWTWGGGHADGDDDMLYVAKKEAKEETGLCNIKLLKDTPISIESLPVLAHVKCGKFVPAHVHLNVTYLFEADEKEPIRNQPEENKAVAWMTFDELISKSKEPYMIPVYKKIIARIDEMKREK